MPLSFMMVPMYVQLIFDVPTRCRKESAKMMRESSTLVNQLQTNLLTLSYLLPPITMSFLYSFFSSLLYTIGWKDRKPTTVILLGLDNAGKTTLQYKLKHGHIQQFLPTQRAKEELITLSSSSSSTSSSSSSSGTASNQVRLWDLGGHKSARLLWKKYFNMVRQRQINLVKL